MTSLPQMVLSSIIQRVEIELSDWLLQSWYYQLSTDPSVVCVLTFLEGFNFNTAGYGCESHINRYPVLHNRETREKRI